jgi:hypothetical protein
MVEEKLGFSSPFETKVQELEVKQFVEAQQITMELLERIQLREE